MIGDFYVIFYVIFGEFFGWDWGTPAILRQNPNKITVLCGCGFGFKSWDWVRPVGTKSQLWPKISFAGSLHVGCQCPITCQ